MGWGSGGSESHLKAINGPFIKNVRVYIISYQGGMVVRAPNSSSMVALCLANTAPKRARENSNTIATIPGCFILYKISQTKIFSETYCSKIRELCNG